MAPRNTPGQGRWPLHTAYQQAMRSPNMYFQDQGIKAGAAEIGLFGLPEIYSGNFGCVFKFNLNGTDTIGLKCFSNHRVDRERRYADIGRFNEQITTKYLMSFQYKPDEVLVEGRRFPVLMMEWIPGSPLDTFIETVLERGAPPAGEFMTVAQGFVHVMKVLENARVAHGDLQHGNILVTANGIRLVDLDGMFVPTIAELGAMELGLSDYQHPRRDGYVFGPELDHFSALVIYISLIALEAEPELWTTYHKDQNLIFEADDFIEPAVSPLFQRLKSMRGEISRLTEILEACCAAPPLATPALSSLVAGAGWAPRRVARPKIEVGDATGHRIEELFLCLTQDAGGGQSGSSSFLVRNTGIESSWVSLTLNPARLEIVGPRAFSVAASTEQTIVCRAALREDESPEPRASITVAVGGEPGERPAYEFVIDVKMLVMRITEPNGAVLRDRTFELNGLSLRDRKATLTMMVENRGSIEIDVEPFTREDWLTVTTTSPIRLKPGETQTMAVLASLGANLPADPTATIGARARPLGRSDVALEEGVRVGFRGVGLIPGRLLSQLPFRGARAEAKGAPAEPPPRADQ